MTFSLFTLSLSLFYHHQDHTISISFEIVESIVTPQLIIFLLDHIMPVAPDEEAVVRCETTKGPVIMKFERVRLKIQVSLKISYRHAHVKDSLHVCLLPLENFLMLTFQCC